MILQGFMEPDQAFMESSHTHGKGSYRVLKEGHPGVELMGEV